MPVMTATIANTASLSEIVDLQGMALARIILPAGWTAADITFKVGAQSGTVGNYINEAGDDLKITAPAASEVVRLPPLDWDGVRYVQFRSGTAAVPVAQGAERILVLDVVRRD